MSANPLKGEVAIPALPGIAGFERGGVLVLDFNALCTLEHDLGDTIEKIGLDALQSPRMMRSVFRVALEEHHGAIEDRTAGKIIQELGPERAAEIVLESFQLSFPEAAKKGTDDPR